MLLQPERELVSIRLSLPSEAPFEAWEMLSKIRTLSSDEITMFAVASPELVAQKPRDWEIVSDMERQRLLEFFAIDPLDAILESRNQFPGVNTESARVKEAVGPLRVRQALYSVASATVPGGQDHIATLLESRLWIAGDAMPRSTNTKLEWELEDRTKALSICVDGRSLAFEEIGNRVRCEFHHAGLCAEVVLTTSHERNPIDARLIDAPQLQFAEVESRAFVSNEASFRLQERGEEISPATEEATVAALSRTCLQLFSDTLGQQRVAVSASHVGSAWNGWQQYWSQRVSDYLYRWATMPNALNISGEGADYGETVFAWHELRKKYRLSHVPFPSPHRPDQRTVAMGNNAEPSSAWTSQLGNSMRWISMFLCIMFLAFVAWMQGSLARLQARRPWWCLMALGAAAWLITGSAIPFLVLGTIGMVVLIDSYWIFTGRLRRIGLLGPRSL
jgi:hypothetical protein